MVMHIERAHLDELLERIPDTIDFDIDAGACCRDLGQWLDRTLSREYGLAFVTRDEDGRIPVPLGDNVVYIEQGDDDAKFLTVSALLLDGVEVTLALLEAVNGVNAQTPLAKTLVADGRVVTAVDLPVVDTLSPQDLLLAIEIVGATAVQFGERLHSRFGSVDA